EMPTAGGARRAAWNGHDFYAVLGGRSWEDCRRLGFISAGGGEFYSKPLEALFPGARVFTYKPGAGYVGIGRVLARSVPITEFKVASNAECQLLLLEVPGLDARFREFHEHPQKREHVVAVEWIATKSAKEAVWDT